jgi:hypothetical protein
VAAPAGIELGAVDWKAVGAIAGPVLALLSLAWQASERLRRPLLETYFRPDSYSGGGREGRTVQVTGTARVINPRSASLIVRRVELQARRREMRRLWRHRVLASNERLRQIPATDEDELTVTDFVYMEPRTLRVVVRLKGLHRALKGGWKQDVCGDLVRRVLEENERERARKAA